MMQAELLESVTRPAPAERQIDTVCPEMLITSVVVFYVGEVEHGVEIGQLIYGITLLVAKEIVWTDE